MSKTQFNNLDNEELDKKLDGFYEALKGYGEPDSDNLKLLVGKIVEAEIEMEGRCNQ